MRIVLIGFGNLGRALVQVFAEKAEILREHEGFAPKIIAAVDDSGAAVEARGLDMKTLVNLAKRREKIEKYPGAKAGRSALEVIESVDADLVVELTPTNIKTGEPGLSHIRKAMEAGRHVVTSNKGPLVVAFKELDSLARKKGVEFRYSASVGGAIPVISLARRLMSSNKILEIRGILNGTTNYILTRMEEENVPLEMVVREAQELGIAEKDPSLDIDGIDTAAKLLILHNAVLGGDLKLSDVEITGIRKVTPEAIRLAKEAGYALKLVGVARRGELEVSPKLVPLGHPLSVGGTLNAITFKLDLAREISIAGFGAGPMETVSSILADILEIHRSLG
ncbi:MAG: homoserine dehydrogenase [Candidatus Hadarchaeales archaeon]